MDNSEIMQAMGRRLRERRKRVCPRDTQQTFAERLGIERKTVMRMEKGDPRVAFGTYVSAAIILKCQSAVEELFNLPFEAPPLQMPKRRRVAA